MPPTQRYLLALPLLLASLAACQQPDEPLHARDGGTRERMTSIDVVPAANAPFSATVVTDWTHILPDGSSATVKNHRFIARDSSGRVFEERRFFSPKGDTETTAISSLDFIDPNRHERYVCHPSTHTCVLTPYYRSAKIVLPPPGPLANGEGTLKRESLGQQSMQDLDVIGSREIITLKAGAVGNQEQQPIVKEFWFSPRLSLNLVTKRFDPISSSAQNIAVTRLDLSEPDPKLFEPPASYTIIRTRAQQDADNR